MVPAGTSSTTKLTKLVKAQQNLQKKTYKFYKNAHKKNLQKAYKTYKTYKTYNFARLGHAITHIEVSMVSNLTATCPASCLGNLGWGMTRGT